VGKLNSERVICLNFEADDEFMAEVAILRVDAQDWADRTTAFQAEIDRRYAEAVSRFRERLLGKKEEVN
jgi:nitrogenase molybdenum-iron protein alpha/beta subunit